MGTCCSSSSPKKFLPNSEDITSLSRDGEKAAGWLHKRAHQGSKWQYRFFVLKNGCLFYFSSQSRSELKGCIRLLNITVSVKPDNKIRQSPRHLFDLLHEQRRAKELYSESSKIRSCWITAIQSEVISLNNDGSREGYIYKLGGPLNNQWQMRWCILQNGLLEYFKNPNDSTPKGYINLRHATVMSPHENTESSDGYYIFEVIFKRENRKESRKFAVKSRVDLVEWQSRLSKHVDQANQQANDGHPNMRMNISDTASEDSVRANNVSDSFDGGGRDSDVVNDDDEDEEEVEKRKKKTGVSMTLMESKGDMKAPLLKYEV